MQRFNRRETYFIANTLNCVPLVLLGKSVLIDLLDECSVAGRISSADGLMNIHLENVVYIDRNGGQYPFEEFMVRSRVIRQIHIPGDIDMQLELQQWFQNGLKTSKANNKQGKRSLKQKRAEERHKEILQHITQPTMKNQET